ncbi:hypothetical protein BsWGS_10549 [Bradybaena similaris]
MSQKLVLTFVVCSIWLDAASPEGTHFSKCRFVQGKSCETKQEDTGQNIHEQGHNLLLNNANFNGRQNSGRRTLMSRLNFITGLRAGKPASIFVNILRRQWQQQQLLEKQRQVSPKTHKLGAKRSVVHHPEGSAARTSDQWRQDQRDLAKVWQERNSVHDNQSNEEIIRFRNDTDTYEKLEMYVSNTRNAHVIHHRKSNPHPNVKRLGHEHNSELLHLSSQEEKPYGKFLTESSTIHPFIATRQALDYLTNYDSKPPPRRYPLRLLLPEREHNTFREHRADGNGTEGAIDGLRYGTWGRRRKNRHTRSSSNSLLEVSGNGTRNRVEIQREAHVKDKNKLVYENTDGGEFEDGSLKYAETPVSDYRQKQIINVTNQKSRDIQCPQCTAAPMSTNIETASRSDRKHKSRVRQQQKKRKKKSRKRKKQKMPETNFTTTTATNEITQISAVDSVHALLTRAVIQTPQNEHTAKNTSNGPNTTTESNVSLLLRREDVSEVKLVAGATDNAQLLEDCLFNQTCEQGAMSGRSGHNKLDTDAGTSTSHSTRKQRQQRPNRNKSQNNKSKLKGKSNNSKVSIQTKNITDSHMSVSLKSDFIATTFFIPINSKTVLYETTVKARSENYAQESTTVSSANRRQIVSDRSPPAHVPALTDSGLHEKPVVAGWATWPLSQTVWAINYSRTDDVSKNRGRDSADQEMSQAPSMFTTNKTTTVRENITTASSQNVEKTLKSLSVTSSWLKTSMKSPSANTSQRSPPGFWKNRLKKYHQENGDGENDQKYNYSRNSNYDNKRDESPTSIGEAYHTSSSGSTKDLRNGASAAKKGNQETLDNGPFIGYKTAYDFLSHQRVPKTNIHSEGRREANELNRFMGEGMCKIFNKHYVPTRIGGKCE